MAWGLQGQDPLPALRNDRRLDKAQAGSRQSPCLELPGPDSIGRADSVDLKH